MKVETEYLKGARLAGDDVAWAEYDRRCRRALIATLGVIALGFGCLPLLAVYSRAGLNALTPLWGIFIGLVASKALASRPDRSKLEPKSVRADWLMANLPLGLREELTPENAKSAITLPKGAVERLTDQDRLFLIRLAPILDTKQQRGDWIAIFFVGLLIILVAMIATVNSSHRYSIWLLGGGLLLMVGTAVFFYIRQGVRSALRIRAASEEFGDPAVVTRCLLWALRFADGLPRNLTLRWLRKQVAE